MDATVQDRETPLKGKTVRIRPRIGKAPPALGNRDYTGMAGVVEKLQLVTTCNGEVLLSYWVRFPDGDQATFSHARLEPVG